jgi:hypothetical protein
LRNNKELEARLDNEPEERNLIMQLSPLFLERIAAAEQKGNLIGHQDFVLHLLSKRMRVAVPIAKRPPSGIELADSSACAKGDRIKALSVEALLEFHGVDDLVAWLGEE